MSDMFNRPRHPNDPSERDQGALIARAAVLADQLNEASAELSQVVREIQAEHDDSDDGGATT